MNAARTLILFVCLGAALLAACEAKRTDNGFNEAAFLNPPREVAPRIRWWWPGGAVTEDEISNQLALVADAGFGGVELQPFTIGMTTEDIAADPQIRTVGSQAFLKKLAHVAAETKRLGLTWDLTLGSAWPSGAPGSWNVSEKQLIVTSVEIPSPYSGVVTVPPLEVPKNFEFMKLFISPDAAFDTEATLLHVYAAPLITSGSVGEPVDVTAAFQGGQATGPLLMKPHIVFAVYENHTSHGIFGHAYVEPAWAVDHFSSNGVDFLIREQWNPWFDAIGASPDRVFIDSFELYGELPWTPDFALEFRRRLGYDIAPYIPFILRSEGEYKYVDAFGINTTPKFVSTDPEKIQRVREDYENVRGELFNESFVVGVQKWASSRHTTLRMQAHGGWGHVLDDYASVDVPETEGLYAGGSFDFLKLASSAAHVSGAPLCTAESFVNFNTHGNQGLTENGFWLLTGRLFTAGIQQPVYHGLAYPYTLPSGSMWYPFNKLVFTNDIRLDDAKWKFLRPLVKAQTRLAYAMTRGEHTADIAWLMPEREFPDKVDLVAGDPKAQAGEGKISAAVRRTGLIYDRVSPKMLAHATAASGNLLIGKAAYRGLLITELTATEPEMLSVVSQAIAAGVPVVILGSNPIRATGLRDKQKRDAAVTDAWGEIATRAVAAMEPDGIAMAFAARGVRPRLEILASASPLNVDAREWSQGRLFLAFNESDKDVSASVRIAGAGSIEIYNPETGRKIGTVKDEAFTLSLPAERGRILVVRK